MARWQWGLAVAACAALAACATPWRADGRPGDPGAEPYVQAMLANESSYQDITLDVVRIYERYGVPNQEDSAHEVPGIMKKKGTDRAVLQEFGPVDFYRRNIYVTGSQVTTIFTTGGQRTVETLPFSLDAAMQVGNWDYVLLGVQGNAGTVRFTPLPASGAMGIVESIDRTIDLDTGVSLSATVAGVGGWSIQTTCSNVQPLGANGPYMAMEQLTVFDMGGMRLVRTSTFSNVLLNSGIPDEEFEPPIAMSDPISSRLRYGFLPSVLLLGSTVYLMGRRRIRTPHASDPDANARTAA